MGFNPRLYPLSAESATFGSVATNSSARIPFFVAKAAGQVLGASIVNGTTASVASGTTAGSAVNVYLTKTSTATGSRIASFNGSGTDIATQASQALTMSTSTALTRFSAGDLFFAEVVGGAANNASNAGLFVQLDYIYGHAVSDSATP